MFGSLESLLNPEQKHEMVTLISVDVFPGVLQTEQKYIGKWREAIEAKMNIQHSEHPASQVQDIIQDEMMGRKEAIDRKNQCNRIPIKLRKNEIRLRQDATLKMRL